jgi:putative ABC transport system permease protein
MVKDYLVNALRFIKRNKKFAFINVLGLTIGFTSLLQILFFVNHELSFDQFHANKAHVFRVNFSYRDNAGNVTTLVNAPPALATNIVGKFPELESITRMRYAMNCLLSNGQTGFYEDHGYYADSLFLEILQFEFLSGDPDKALDQPNSIVITKELALKYFNDPNPLGATLVLNNNTPLKVTGILSDIPTNSHLNFDFLISFSTYTVPEGYLSDLTSMEWLGFLTYVELTPGASPELFEKKLIQYFRDLTPEDTNPMVPVVQNLTDIYLGSTGMPDDLASHIRSGNRFSINALMMVAALILIIAGFNFANLNNALSLTRSKATGVRKVLGANKKGILIQLLTESLTITFFCLLFSFAIFLLVFPVTMDFMGWELSLGYKETLKIVPALLLIGTLIGILAGLYPALFLAKSDIIKSLKGTLKVARSNPFQVNNVLILLQFAISIGLISASFVMARQIDYLRNKSTGYNTEHVILIEMLPSDMARYFGIYKEKLAQHASVISASRSERVVGNTWPWSIIRNVNENPENSKRVFFNQVDYDYFKTMGIQLHRGRPFSKAHVNDSTQAIIINRQAAKYLGLGDNPIGQQVHFFDSDGPRTIVGVVEDFNYTSLHHEIGPTVFVLPSIHLEYMYVRFAAGDIRAHIGILEDSWKQVSQGTPLGWRFLNDDLYKLYQSEEKLLHLIQAFSLLAILLACLGLYGMVAFMINNRIKEIGVRKILGASVNSLYTLFAGAYVCKILLAMVIILPFIHYLLQGWVNDFAYHININWWIYPLATLLLIAVVLCTITFQIMKAIRINPTGLLRNE